MPSENDGNPEERPPLSPGSASCCFREGPCWSSIPCCGSRSWCHRRRRRREWLSGCLLRSSSSSASVLLLPVSPVSVWDTLAAVRPHTNPSCCVVLCCVALVRSPLADVTDLRLERLLVCLRCCVVFWCFMKGLCVLSSHEFPLTSCLLPTLPFHSIS